MGEICCVEAHLLDLFTTTKAEGTMTKAEGMTIETERGKHLLLCGEYALGAKAASRVWKIANNSLSSPVIY